MKSAVPSRVGVWFVASVDERAAIHRVDAHEHTEKIRALRNLKNPGCTGCALRFDPHLSSAGEDLARDKKWQDSGDDAIPCDFPTHQIIVVTAVTMPNKVSVVLVKTDFVGRR